MTLSTTFRNIYIRILAQNDIAEIRNFFHIVIHHTYTQEDIIDPDDERIEVENQLNLVNQVFDNQQKDIFFNIAVWDDQIIGTGAFCPANPIIRKYLNKDFEQVPEVASIYVLPDFQNQGIGTELFNSVVFELKTRNVSEFCLDGGYRKSQGFWRKKLGDPEVVLPNYWGPGADHMIWCKGVGEVKAGFVSRTLKGTVTRL